MPVSMRNKFVGVDTIVPLLDGSRCRYINLDNAASTPPMSAVQKAINDFLPFYSSVHRGTGFKSQLSTHLYDEARKTVMHFLGANPAQHTCIFGKNTTEALNKLAHRLPFPPGRNVVLVSTMEHHSNDLPWRSVAEVVHIPITEDGRLDEAAFDRLLEEFGSRLALVSITGASNVTGYINPIHRLAEKTHAAGALFSADCAQLAPHRRVEMLDLADPRHLDFCAISAHKMYAPFGTGAMVGRKDIFNEGEPDYRGGGEVEIVTLDEVVWSEAPERDEAGSPNTVGAVALSAAIHQLEEIGMDEVAAHEAELTAYLLEKLADIPGLMIYGDPDPANAAERLGVVPVNLQGMSHYLVAAILGFEFGIGVRNGCFCAHPYLLELMNVDESHAKDVRDTIKSGDRRDVPGLVRISFGLYNEKEDIDAVVDALHKIARAEYRGKYIQDTATGAYQPEGWQVDFNEYFTVAMS